MKKNLFIILLLVCCVSIGKAQGLFQDDELNPPFDGEESYDAELRALPPLPTDNPGGDSPVGEGLLILSMLAGGYAIIKNKNAKKENNL